MHAVLLLSLTLDAQTEREPSLAQRSDVGFTCIYFKRV